MKLRWILWIALGIFLPCSAMAFPQEQPGSIRGSVIDKDFDAPLAGTLVTIVETGQKAKTSDQGSFVFPQVAPGRYTLIFSKDGYIRQVRAEVLVAPGQLVDVDAS